MPQNALLKACGEGASAEFTAAALRYNRGYFFDKPNARNF
jgi:hypothetical protein